jgi:formamidopyrimidine-DNA glycosylase
MLKTLCPNSPKSKRSDHNSPNILHTPLKLAGLSIEKIHRKGKMLDFHLSDQSHLLSHLGMTGTWLVSTTPPQEKHDHIKISGYNLNSEIYLTYNDPRRFGHLYHLDADKAEMKLEELGLDLTLMNQEQVTNAIKRFPDRALKVTLLDQKLFAGSGNYIANEICARAGIRPTRKCSKIKNNEFAKIHQAISLVLNPALLSGGTTFQGGYRDTTGERGLGVNHLVVFYQKICQLCKKTAVKKVILAQRGTYFCPYCQK